MLRQKYLFIVASILATSPVLAKPVYLKCSYTNGDGREIKFQSKVDEETNAVTHTNSNGHSFNAKGFFTADSITCQDVTLIAGLRMTNQYSISRVNLSMNFSMVAESVEFPDKIEPVTASETGKCELVEVANRAF